VLKAFIAFLGGEEGEERKMWLLLGMGFFMGIFLATYQVGAESLFIQDVGAHYLDVAFFVTGLLGIISTIIYVFLQKRVGFGSLSITNTFLIFLFIVALRFSFSFFDSPEVMGVKILPFILFVMIGPITVITLLGFWGLFGRIFDTRQAKRIIGGIDTGQLTATIIAFFSIPLILKYVPYINETYDLLTVAAISSFGVMFFNFYIALTWNVSKITKIKKGEEVQKIGYTSIWKDPYTKLLSIFLIFSTGAAVFVDFTFYSATEIMFPEEDELNTFLSFFNGTVMIMSFLIQSFVNDIIIGRFGLKIALMVMPSILILFTVGGIISGHFFGFQIKTEEFLLFFMFTVSAKAFTASLKDALEQPAFKLFFLPFNVKVRFDIQTRVEGVVGEFAGFISGAVQIAMGLIAFITLIHYSYLIIGIALVVIYLSYKLYNEYKETLKKTLQRQKYEMADEGKKNEYNAFNIIRNEMWKNDPRRIIFGLKVYEKLDPLAFEFSLLDQLKSHYPEVRKYAYKKLIEFEKFSSLDIIKREVSSETDEELKALGQLTIKKLQDSFDYQLNEESIRQLIRSMDAEDRIRGARLLTKITEDKHLSFVVELIRDINPEVRKAALETAGKLKRAELWPVLVESLHQPAYSNTAAAALAFSGETAFHTVDSSFYKTGQYKDAMIRIVQILGKVGGRQATDLLWKKIDFPDKRIISELLLSLSYMGFQAKDFQAARIKLIIQALVGDMAWNIRTMQDIPKDTRIDKMIYQSMKEENRVNFENIFMLLGMVYDPQSVTLVRENLNIGSIESVTFAIEMMDVFCDEELKPRLFPVFDEIKDSQRLERLIEFYPPEHFESYNDLLLQIINRDYNRITRYTKALALYRLQSMENAKITYDLIANLFNPDKLLLQAAASTIYKIDPEAYKKNVSRLKPSIRKDLDAVILPPVYLERDEDYRQPMTLIEKVIHLRNTKELKDVSGEQLSFLADFVEEIRVNEGYELIKKGNNGTVPFYVVIDGSLVLMREGDKDKILGNHTIVGEEFLLASETYNYTLRAMEKTTLLVINKDEWTDLLSKCVPFVEAYFHMLNHDIVDEVKSGVDLSIFDEVRESLIS
jgi:AAA family ATP:ADP antiporter